MHSYSHEYVKDLAKDLHGWVELHASTPECVAIVMSNDLDSGGWTIEFDPSSRFDPDETAFDGRDFESWTGGQDMDDSNFDALASDIRNNMIELDGNHDDR